MPAINRRNFLKIGSALSGALAVSPLAPRLPQAASRPSILLFVFDAMSARNMALYGYRRKNTPNLERLAQRATVFHQHYSAGTFTTPGTASLLTGLYPWTHRAINYSGLIAREHVEHNIFRTVGKEFYRLAFSQNLWPNYFFAQFHRDIEKRLSPAAFSIVDQIIGDKVSRDLQASYRAFEDFMLQDGMPPASLVLGVAERILLRRAYARAQSADYPRGLPRAGNYPIFFTIKDVFDGLISTVEGLSAPYLAYLHTWPPHDPYRPSKEFDHYFADGWRPRPKPEHPLAEGTLAKQINDHRQNYDEYIANLDFEFGHLLDVMQARGVLEQSYVIVTSDHGDLFERGEIGHTSPLLYEGVVHIPLMISAPGQRSRRDINVPTSSIDLLPTLASLSGAEVPSWAEGQLLPGFGGPQGSEQSIFLMYAKENSAFSRLQHRTGFGLRKGPYKLTYYEGFYELGGKNRFELYDIENDPEELNDLYSESLPIAKELRAELLAKIQAENARFKA